MGCGESKSFRDILENIWWKIDKNLTLEDIKYSGYATFVESIKNGVTTIFDHHTSPMAVEGSLVTLSEVAEEIGIRGVFCYEVSDRDGKEILEADIKENVDFIKYANEREDDMIKGLFGMHASFTLTNESLVKCTKAMKGLDAGYHIHVSEGIEDLLNSLKVSNKRTIQRLNDYGILGEKTLAIHCIYINGEEIELLKATNTSVINNPESNMSNAVGTSPVLKMVKEGKATKACILMGEKLKGKQVVTVEGLDNRLKEIFAYAFTKAAAVQCGFCIPGMVISAVALFKINLYSFIFDLK